MVLFFKKEHAFYFLLASLTLLRLLVAGITPLSPDEAYYWVWSRALAPGYLDHPPMVAFWIRSGTALAGDGALGVRLLAPLSAALGSLMLFQAGKDLFPGRRAGLTAALLLNATLLFGVGAVTMTPDTPLLFFWTACLWAMARLHRTGRGAWWLVAGLSTGLALASKYTAILLPVGLGLWSVFLPAQRRWLLRPMPWLGAALAGVIFLPVLMWNAGHGWASFAKQGGRGLIWRPALALRYLAELIGGQLGLATPLVCLLCAAGIASCVRLAWRMRTSPEGLVTTFTLPGILLFLQHAIGDRVQANWPAVLYPAAALGAARLGSGWTGLVKPAVMLGAVVTGVVYVQAALHPFWLGLHADPTSRLIGWNEFSDDVGRIGLAQGAAFIAADGYGVASLLARSDIPLPVVGAEPRWQLFDLPVTDLHARPGILVRAGDRTGNPVDQPAAALIGQVTRKGHGRPLESFRIYLIIGNSEEVVLPRRGALPRHVGQPTTTFSLF